MISVYSALVEHEAHDRRLLEHLFLVVREARMSVCLLSGGVEAISLEIIKGASATHRQ